MSRSLLGAAVLACLLLTGCTSLEGTGDKGYISGDRTVRVIEPGDRGEPIKLSGDTLTGDPVDVDDLRGKPVVVNTWWSGCAPCRTEMPLLTAADKELQGQAAFLGINIRDASTQQGLAFMNKVGADYPSIWDPKGQKMLAFAGQVSMAAIPTTIVLDVEGRVAAVIAGEIPSRRTLLDVVDQVAGEPADG